MTWIIVAAVVVIFIIGYRLMTTDTRKAIASLAHLLKINPLLVETMLQEMGTQQSQIFVQEVNNGYAGEMRKAAYLLFIFHTFIKNQDESNIVFWRHKLLQADLSPMLSAEHSDAALFYFAELDIDSFELAQFRRSYNQTFNQLTLAS